jgi:hypothetical protein
MKPVKLITDSAVDLPKDLQEKYDISILPLNMHWEGKNYLDRIDIQPTECYERMVAGAPLPKTSQVTVAQFVELQLRFCHFQFCPTGKTRTGQPRCISNCRLKNQLIGGLFQAA